MIWALVNLAICWLVVIVVAVRMVADDIEAEPTAWKRRAALAAVIIFAPVLLFIVLLANVRDCLAWAWRVVRRHP